MFLIWQSIVCINDKKNNPDIPELTLWQTYIVKSITHWRPQIEIQWEEGIELVHYNPNRFEPYKSKEEIEIEIQEKIEKMKQSISDEEYKMIKQNMYRYNKSLKKW